ncbi:MAG: hypothetical protein ABS46_15180 [Cytophagaceae bacterium SCN 52-12]|nr:MAG: hypothetical protein ABS46_15180 [Cytophagaceae bacterium SCN 52-12]
MSPELKGQPAGTTGGIKGKITDQQGAPLPFAGINVKGTNLGTLSNSEGIYELFLDPGEYTVHFQYLGFRTETKEISVTGGIMPLDVSLREQALALRELQVGKDPEDPAYTIMRKAISKARFHQLQVQSYSASVYARSTALPTKIPVLMRKRLKKQGISEGVAFVNESVTKVDYQRPNSYKQKIISTQNNLDNSAPTPNEFIFASFYNPEVGGTVTPLSPKAPGIYKFEYEGYFEDRGEIVNKIKVTPKSFKQGVFRGSIYIIDGKWSIHSFNLETIWQGFSIRVRQLFAPSQNVWIPGSQHFDINGSYLGFAGKFTYIVSIKYDRLRIDPALKENVTIVDTRKEPEAKPEIADVKKLEELLSDGQKTDTKSFRKMVKQYEKEQRKEENPDLSARETRRDSIIVEPLANKRDSAYWAAMRSVPLTHTEVVSYAVSDSLTAARTGNKPADSTSFRPQHLLTGARYRYGRGRSLSLAPPLRSVGFNPAEAFHLDLSAEWLERYAGRKSFSIAPGLHYSTGRNRISPTLKLQLNHRGSSVYLEGGEQIAQFNPQQPIPPAINSLYYLLFNQNHIRLFQKQFIGMEYRQRQLFHILDLAAGIETGRRSLLANLMKPGELLWGDPHLARNDNMPDNAENPSLLLLPDDRYTAISIRLDIRPWQKFSVRNGRKRFFNNNRPVFTVQYRKGISLFNSRSDYDFLEGGIRYEPKVFAASTLQMSVSGGKFLNRNAVFFPDFKHFMGNRTVVQTGDHLSGFRMLPYYRYSTSRRYIQAHVSFNSPKLLLTQLPLLRMAGLKEYIQGHVLHTPGTTFYTEQVYGIDGILKIFRFELVTHFDRDLYLGPGFRIGTVFNF